MTTRKENYQKKVEALADWLLGDSVSFIGLDRHRKTLKKDVPGFTKVLGISQSCYSTWRNQRRVPLRNRDFYHEKVLGYLEHLLDSQNPHLEHDTGSLELSFSPTPLPNQTLLAPLTFSANPHWFIPLSEATQRRDKKQMESCLKHEIRERHCPLPGDDYRQCECSICQEVK